MKVVLELNHHAMPSHHGTIRYLEDSFNFCNNGTFIEWNNCYIKERFTHIYFLLSSNTIDLNTMNRTAKAGHSGVATGGRIVFKMDGIRLGTIYVEPTYSWTNYQRQALALEISQIQTVERMLSEGREAPRSIRIEFEGGTGICNLKKLELAQVEDTIPFIGYRKSQRVIRQFSCTSCSDETTVLVRRDHIAQCDGGKSFYFPNSNFEHPVDRIQFEVASAGKTSRGSIEVSLVHPRIPSYRVKVCEMKVKPTGGWHEYAFQSIKTDPAYRYFFQLPSIKVACKFVGQFGIGNFKTVSFIQRTDVELFQKRMLTDSSMVDFVVITST